jgi:hypothetical protein
MQFDTEATRARLLEMACEWVVWPHVDSACAQTWWKHNFLMDTLPFALLRFECRARTYGCAFLVSEPDRAQEVLLRKEQTPTCVSGQSPNRYVKRRAPRGVRKRPRADAVPPSRWRARQQREGARTATAATTGRHPARPDRARFTTPMLRVSWQFRCQSTFRVYSRRRAETKMPRRP